MKNKKYYSHELAIRLNMTHDEFKQIFHPLDNIYNIGYELDAKNLNPEKDTIFYIFNGGQISYIKRIFSHLNTYIQLVRG